MMALENADRTNVISWVKSLSSLATDYSGLSDDSKLLMAQLCEVVLLRSIELSLTFEDVSGLENVVDMSFSISQERKTENLTLFQSLLKLYGELSVNDMIEGQNELKVMTPLPVIFILSLFFNLLESLKLSSPESVLEALSNQTLLSSSHSQFLSPR
jgi:hypothetical protein